MIALLLTFLLIFIAISEGYCIATHIGRTLLVVLLSVSLVLTSGLYVLTTLGGSDSDTQDNSATATSVR